MNDGHHPEINECFELRFLLQSRPPGMTRVVFFGLLLLVSLGIVWAMFTTADLVVQGRARVRPADSARTSIDAEAGELVYAEAGGRVVELFVEDGQIVGEGDPLFRLDTERLEIESARIREGIDTLQQEVSSFERLEQLTISKGNATVRRLEAEILLAEEQAEQRELMRISEVRVAEMALGQARQKQAQVRKLAEEGLAPDSETWEAERTSQAALESLAQARIMSPDQVQPLRRQRSQLAREHALRTEQLRGEIMAKQGQIRATQHAVAELERKRTRSVITAHRSGQVSLGELGAGDVVEPGTPAMAITPTDGLRVDAAVATSDVGGVESGMPVRIKIDAYDHRHHGTLTGTISYVSPDSRTARSPAGEVHYYLVSVKLDPVDSAAPGHYTGEVRLGMTGRVEIVTERRPLLALLFSKIRRTISLG